MKSENKNRKTIKIIYWTFTFLISGLMLSSSIPEIIGSKQGTDFMIKLGYPLFINPFLGVAKLLGVIAILIPGFSKIKEWAYAGLFFDLAGATYSFIAIGIPFSNWIFMIVFIGILAGSYIFYHKNLKLSEKNI